MQLLKYGRHKKFNASAINGEIMKNDVDFIGH